MNTIIDLSKFQNPKYCGDQFHRFSRSEVMGEHGTTSTTALTKVTYFLLEKLAIYAFG